MKVRVFILFLFLFGSKYAISGILPLGSWNIVNLKYSHNKNISLFAEAQLRSLKFYRHFHYYEYKGGFNYKATENLTLSLGCGSYQTYAEGGNFVLPKNNDEFRIWPQITMNQNFGKYKVEHRYRAEFRFTSNGYRNRFRYRVSLICPLLEAGKNGSALDLNVGNEIFFTDRGPYFERNRMNVSFLWKTSKGTSFTLGYLHQFDYKINDETGRDFLQIGVYLNVLRKKR